MVKPAEHDYSTVVASLCRSLLSEEGVIPWLYLDTAGIVTAGCGHAIRSADDCAALPWRSRYSADALRQAWADIHATIPADRGLLLHRGARHYTPMSTPRLTPDDIENILTTDVSNFIRQIEHAIPNYPEYPAGPQEAILDLCFNLGVHGFVGAFKQCYGCVVSRNWAGAAATCKRRAPISEARNTHTSALFLSFE